MGPVGRSGVAFGRILFKHLDSLLQDFPRLISQRRQEQRWDRWGRWGRWRQARNGQLQLRSSRPKKV